MKSAQLKKHRIEVKEAPATWNHKAVILRQNEARAKAAERRSKRREAVQP